MRGWRYYSIEFVLITLLGVAVAYFGYLLYGLIAPSYALEPFSGERAQFHISQQLEFGERTAGSSGGQRTAEWLTGELSDLGWDVIIQSYGVGDNRTAHNIIAQSSPGPVPGPEPDPVLILATHYDTRAASDRDRVEGKRSDPTPGANAGASGAALLLELARVLDVEATGHSVCLVFFDAEENGGLPGWDYAMGSAEFLRRIAVDTPRCRSPRAAVYVDLVGGAGASIAAIAPDAPRLVHALRRKAEQVGYGAAFQGPHIRDEVDALARLATAGIPAVMVADMGYQHRHTTLDTLTRISADSLQRTGDILKAWLEEGAPF